MQQQFKQCEMMENEKERKKETNCKTMTLNVLCNN